MTKPAFLVSNLTFFILSSGMMQFRNTFSENRQFPGQNSPRLFLFFLVQIFRPESNTGSLESEMNNND